MREQIKIIFIVFVLFLSDCFGQTIDTISLDVVQKKLPFGLIDYIPAHKPKIAFALSGGGARGLSQIGVLKAFEEAGIKPDLIVGTSIGSIVGGMYAAGYTIDQVDSIARNTDWNDLLTLKTQSNRRDLFVDQKVTEDRAIFSLRLDGLNPILPTSFNDGQKLSNQLNIITFNAPLHSETSFDLLAIKFIAVCTDLITGNMVLMDRGSLSNALRASSSVTFFLAPIKMDSLLLVDGGLVANIPVEIAKNNGGDFVIAINTTSNLWPEEKLYTPWIVADQIVSIPMKQNNMEQLNKADFVVTPKLNDILLTDFNMVDSLIFLGYQSAKPLVNTIKTRIDSADYNSLNEAEKYYYNLKLSNNLSLKEKAFFFGYESTDSISNKKINYDLYKLFETGDYKNLAAKITTSEDESVLDIIKQENPRIDNVDLIGISLIHSDEISDIFSSLKGKPFSGQQTLTEIIKLIQLYREAGYSLAEIQSIEYNPEEKRLKIYVDEGLISRIDVEGNKTTNKNVITREFDFNAGDFFRIQEVKKGLINLRSTKLFDNIDLFVKEENGQNILTISVDEKPSSLLRISFRSDNEYRTQLGLDLRDENLFGTGTELGLILFGGLNNRAILLEQKANRVFDSYLTYKLNAFYKFNDVHVYSDDQTQTGVNFSRIDIGMYRQIFYGLSLGIGTQVGRFGNLIFEGRYQFDEVKNIENNSADPFKTKIVSLKISSTIDTQDKYPFPESGVYFSGFYETAFTLFGGETGYSNISFEYKNYFRLSDHSVVSPKFKFGFADKTLPLSEQYSLGGQESFYGMHDFEFRGRQILLASLMYRYKLPFLIFFDTYLKVQYDLGSTWPEQEQIRFKDLRHGIGGSISFDTPIGPAEFAIGRSFLLRKDIPENPISWGDVLFYFSIGYYY
jgi:NTE family protein